MKKKAIFLDRDGTIIKNKGYICTFTEVEFFDFSIGALKLIHQHRYLAVVVTNQSAVARGICTEKQIETIHRKINLHLHRHHTRIDRFYYCPFHGEGMVEEYKKNSRYRKPAPGMLLKAAEELNIDLEASYMIGDSIGDIIAGNRAGCKTVLVKTGYGRETYKEFKDTQIKIDLVTENLLTAVKGIILEQGE